MNNLAIHGRRIAFTAAGIGLLGAGMATAAQAAPALPAIPSASDVPVPVLTRPIDASSGLFGIDRGSLPGLATPALPGIAQFPGLEIVPLPMAEPAAAPESDTPASASDDPASEAPASDTSAATEAAPAPAHSALSGLDDAGFLAGLPG